MCTWTNTTPTRTLPNHFLPYKEPRHDIPTSADEVGRSMYNLLYYLHFLLMTQDASGPSLEPISNRVTQQARRKKKASAFVCVLFFQVPEKNKDVFTCEVLGVLFSGT